jgi:hypothetical protein
MWDLQVDSSFSGENTASVFTSPLDITAKKTDICKRIAYRITENCRGDFVTRRRALAEIKVNDEFDL